VDDPFYNMLAQPLKYLPFFSTQGRKPFLCTTLVWSKGCTTAGLVSVQMVHTDKTREACFVVIIPFVGTIV
jgi:hypothetical protein